LIPAEVLDAETREHYLHPRTLDLAPPIPDPPRVRIRASRKDQLQLYKLLASSGRVAVLPASRINIQDLNGAFAVFKDADRDSLVVDARPSNRRARALNYWTRTLAMATVLLGILLRPGQVLAIYILTISSIIITPL